MKITAWDAAKAQQPITRAAVLCCWHHCGNITRACAVQERVRACLEMHTHAFEDIHYNFIVETMQGGTDVRLTSVWLATAGTFRVKCATRMLVMTSPGWQCNSMACGCRVIKQPIVGIRLYRIEFIQIQ